MSRENIGSVSVDELEDRLLSFDADVRSDALRELAARADSGEIAVPASKPEVNLHLHTFFSFNANRWSPSRIVWEAKKHGLSVVGGVDFDVLDGMDEFLASGEMLNVPATFAVETRVFMGEYADLVTNSPNEPGISYYMSAGCYRHPDAGSYSAQILKSMRDMAAKRNMQVMERVNAHLQTVQIDYGKDVLPLTPSGNATERHMLAAYDAKAREVYPGDAALAEFWAQGLGMSTYDASVIVNDTPRFHERMRSALMKYGGVGYVKPESDSFPSLETVVEMTRGMGALPSPTWLDGVFPGESDTASLLEYHIAKGALTVNIVPDRNWNIKDKSEREMKVANLGKLVEASRKLDLPIGAGTEMNKAGLKFVDDFSAPELQPFVQDLLDGAHFTWGHTVLGSLGSAGAGSEWCQAHFGNDRRKMNAFYTEVGRRTDQRNARSPLAGIDLSNAAPADILAKLG